jgi:hypothetical protein
LSRLQLSKALNRRRALGSRVFLPQHLLWPMPFSLQLASECALGR